MNVRSVAELTDVEPSAWTAVTETIATSSAHIEILPVEPAAARQTIQALQVTVGSALGAIAYNCGGILIDHGWIRLLGGGTPVVPSLAAANNLAATVSGPPPFLTVGYDVLGGRFAIDGGGLGIAPGEVCYWAPDSLAWEGLELGHGDFLHAFLSGSAGGFYEPWRWPDWEDEVSAVRADQGLSLIPPPFAVEGAEIANVSRRAVPFAELISFYDDVAAQSGTFGPGETFRLRAGD